MWHGKGYNAEAVIALGLMTSMANGSNRLCLTTGITSNLIIPYQSPLGLLHKTAACIVTVMSKRDVLGCVY